MGCLAGVVALLQGQPVPFIFMGQNYYKVKLQPNNAPWCLKCCRHVTQLLKVVQTGLCKGKSIQGQIYPVLSA